MVVNPQKFLIVEDLMVFRQKKGQQPRDIPAQTPRRSGGCTVPKQIDREAVFDEMRCIQLKCLGRNKKKI
jgi:hypothetical protein